MVETGLGFAELSEAQLLFVFNKLDGKRREGSHTLPAQQEDFETWMPGGAFLERTKGEVAQVLQAAPRTKGAQAWAKQYSLPALASFTLANYGEGQPQLWHSCGAATCTSSMMCGASHRMRTTPMMRMRQSADLT